MGFKCGIIGLPNVGKSTLFNILTKLNIPAKNFPFCTIKPNVGIAPVFDIRLYKIAEIIVPNKIINTVMKLVDIAGLVKGASHGLGLGNTFLNNIKDVDVIIHVVRCFNDPNIIHVHNTVKPIYDIEVINLELIFSDLEVCKKEILRLKKKYSILNIKYKKTISILENCLFFLKNLKMLRKIAFNPEELKLINYLNFITLKPMIYIANTSNVTDDKFNDLLNFFKKNKELYMLINIFKEFQNLSYDKDNNIFDKNNHKLNQIVKLGYDLLNLQNFFTVGKKEVRAWTIKKGMNSVEAARKIHTDFQKGFIRAKVIHYLDFIKYKGIDQVKRFGKLKIQGKKYIVKSGDIIEFLFKI